MIFSFRYLAQNSRAILPWRKIAWAYSCSSRCFADTLMIYAVHFCREKTNHSFRPAQYRGIWTGGYNCVLICCKVLQLLCTTAIRTMFLEILQEDPRNWWLFFVFLSYHQLVSLVNAKAVNVIFWNYVILLRSLKTVTYLFILHYIDMFEEFIRWWVRRAVAFYLDDLRETAAQCHNLLVSTQL